LLFWSAAAGLGVLTNEAADTTAAVATQVCMREFWNGIGIAVNLDAGVRRYHVDTLGRRRVHHRLVPAFAATVMRHFLALTLSVAALAIRVSTTSFTACLIAVRGFSTAAMASLRGTTTTAVALPTITIATDKEDLATGRQRASHKPQ